MSFKELFQPNVVNHPHSEIPAPPGFDEITPRKGKKEDQVRKPSSQELGDLKIKKAWEIAMMPAKSLPMNLIMSYMSGNSLQIISIMMTFTLFWNPLKAILMERNTAFLNLQNERNSSEIFMPKVVFVLCHLANMAVGVWKLDQMGLIPNKEADWLSWQAPKQYSEILIN